MANSVSRRGVLRFGAATALWPALGPWLSSAAAATSETADSVSGEHLLHNFALSEVALGSGVFAEKRARMLDFARGFDENRMLRAFRATANLSTGGVAAPGEWEDFGGQGNGLLRGHFAGHFLTMLSQAYASTGDPIFSRKIRTMLDGLEQCRDALHRAPEIRSTAGKFGSALDVQPGSCLYLDVPGRPVEGLRTMTFAAWLRPSTATRWARVFEFGDDTRARLWLTARDDRDLPRFVMTGEDTSNHDEIAGSQPVPVEEWSHVALVLTGRDGTLYLNGNPIGTNKVSRTPADLGSLRHSWIGRSDDDDSSFVGAFEDINVWSRALEQREVADLLRSPAKDARVGPGDRISYSCQETSGTTVRDDSGNGRHAIHDRTWGRPSFPGYVAAYPETQFRVLESLTHSDSDLVWAPYYTAHKILQGLLDAHDSTGDERGMDLAAGLGDWMHARLSRVPHADRQRMWGLYSSGEYGGVVEAVLDLHEHTRKPEHLELARYFDVDSLIASCADNRDVIGGIHANQHIPIFTGLAMLYGRTGQQRYWQSAWNFWRMVVPTRMFAIGGTGDDEFFGKPGAIASLLGPENAESCCAHNMLKLTKTLFLRTRDPVYADYYERALVNQILGSKEDTENAEKPRTTYFIGQQPGAVRDFTPKNGATCCEGTGMENATKYQEFVYATSEDGEELYVNLYLPSTLRWRAKGVVVSQETDFPLRGGSVLRVRGSATFAMNLRVPGWVGPDFEVLVNGREQPITATPGSYVGLRRSWRDGDTVEIRMPFPLRAESAMDDRGVQNLMYGPVNLVIRDASTEFRTLSLYGTARLSGDLSRALTPVPGKPGHFRVAGTELAPFFEGTTDPFHSYFRRWEPRIVFDSLDSGVPNRAARSGTFLDDVWSRAPFPDRDAFVRRVEDVSAQWHRNGGLSQAERDRVLSTARKTTFTS